MKIRRYIVNGYICNSKTYKSELKGDALKHKHRLMKKYPDVMWRIEEVNSQSNENKKEVSKSE